MSGVGWFLVAVAILLLIVIIGNTLLPQEIRFSGLPAEAQCLAIARREARLGDQLGGARRGCPYPFPMNKYLLIPDEEGAELRLYVDRFLAVGGAWAWDRAHVTASGALSGSLPVRNSPRPKDWGTWLSRRHTEVWPFVDVRLPLSNQHVHQWITLDATMNVTYAATNYPGSGFHDSTPTVHRSVDFFVIRRADVLVDQEKAPLSVWAFSVTLAGIGVALVWRAHRSGADFRRIPRGFARLWKGGP
jgi:hypothetical protein